MLTFLKDNAQNINGKVITPESLGYVRATIDPLLNDSAANLQIDILGTHLYGTSRENFEYPLAYEKEKEIWMTEHLTGSNNVEDNDWSLAMGLADEINACMEANFSAYVWWYIQRFYGLISESGNITDKGYVMSQFAKFIRPGAVRVESTLESASNVEISAFKTDTSLVIVVINLNETDVDLNFTIQNSSINSLTQFTSSATKKVVNEGSFTITSGTFSATIEGESISTFTSYAGNAGKCENIVPVANAGSDINVFDDDATGFEIISFNATGSIDTDGEIIYYSWSIGEVGSNSLMKSQISTDSIFNLELDIGEYEVVLTVTDDDGATHADTILVNIESLLTTNLWFEAECTQIGSNWDILTDEDASNGIYLTVKAGSENLTEPTTTDDVLVYEFHLDESGRYKIWARVLTPNADGDSYWVKMDGENWINWNSIPGGNNWNWDDLHNFANNDSTVSYDLDTGYHILSIRFREDDALLDKIFISNTGATPAGLGDPASNCVDNLAPVADAGDDQDVTDTTGTGTMIVTLDGTQSKDDDGTIILYIWTENDNEIATGPNPSVELDVGTHEITLIVIDNVGWIDDNDVIIIVNASTNILSNTNHSDFDINIYPNPFSANLCVTYKIQEANFVKLDLLDITGRLISTVINKYNHSGQHSVYINSNDINSGVYYLRFSVGDEFSKCLLIFKD